MSSVRILLIDNYDSFTYNLVQAFAARGAEVLVYRNDAITVEEAIALKPTHLVISPGPGTSVPDQFFRWQHRSSGATDAWQDFHGRS